MKAGTDRETRIRPKSTARTGQKDEGGVYGNIAKLLQSVIESVGTRSPGSGSKRKERWKGAAHVICRKRRDSNPKSSHFDKHGALNVANNQSGCGI